MPQISVDFSKKALIFVTGASQGIGQSLSIELSRQLNQNSIFILLARSQVGLDETRNAISEIDKGITVITKSVDLSEPNLQNYESITDEILSKIDSSGIEFGIFFHNAGSTGTVLETRELTDLINWQKHFDLNLFSTVLLNSIFLKKIRPIAPQLIVINITSLFGRQPFANFSMYGSAKAARDIFFKILAVEEPNVVVLNYSPGPVNTDMFNGIADNAQSEQLRELFKKMKESVLAPEQTVLKLIGILEKGDYNSGDTIDYFDQ